MLLLTYVLGYYVIVVPTTRRVLIPTVDYAPGGAPPPHLSPFVDADDEGYTPEYQATLQRLQAQAKAAREGRSVAVRNPVSVVHVVMLCGDDDTRSALLRLRLMMHKTILWLNFFD